MGPASHSLATPKLQVERDKSVDSLEYEAVSVVAIGESGQAGDLLGVLAAGERNVDILADGRVLSSLANAVVAQAQEHGAAVLVAASPPAERLVGAALMLAPDTVRGLRGSEAVPADQVVLVIDVNLASGTAMATTARRVRGQGAGQVLGAVFHFLAREVPTASDCGLDALFSLQR